jgi:cbb3-type cytochrome c oxidase subunit III
VLEGQRIYESACASCHGADGVGRGVVPRLQAYPVGAEARFIRAVLEGRTTLGMPPWSGLLTESQIRQVLAYVRALVPPADPAATEGAGPLFRSVCASCHGADAAGTPLAPGLLAFRGDDTAFVDTVLNGRPGTAMAPFKTLITREAALGLRAHVRGLGQARERR